MLQVRTFGTKSRAGHKVKIGKVDVFTGIMQGGLSKLGSSDRWGKAKRTHEIKPKGENLMVLVWKE